MTYYKHAYNMLISGRNKDIYMDLASVILGVAKCEKYLSEHVWALVAIVAGLFLLSILSNRLTNKCLLIIYLGAILYMTLINRNTQGSRHAWLRIFTTYKYFFSGGYLRREILNNIILFIPLGTIIARLWPKWYMAIIPVMVSATIEILQYVTRRGLFETDDIISNSLGGFIGFMAVMLWLYVSDNLQKSLSLKKNE